MALKLNIRWQLALVSVALSLLPIAIVGILAYQHRARRARRAHPLQSRNARGAERREARAAAARSASEPRGVVAARVHPRRRGDGRRRRPHSAVPAGSQAQHRRRAGVVGGERRRHGHRVDAADAARPRSRRPRVSAGRAARRGVGRIAGDAGPDRPRRHAARVSAAGELRSVQAGRRARRRSRLAEDRRRFFRPCACCPKGRTSAAIWCWPTRRACCSRRRRSSPAGSPAGRGSTRWGSTRIGTIVNGAGGQRRDRSARRHVPRGLRHDGEAAVPARRLADDPADARPTSRLRRSANLLWTIVVLSIVLAHARRRRIVVLGHSVFAPDHVARAVPEVGRGRRSLAAAFRSSAATSSACSPMRPTTWPISFASCSRICSRHRFRLPARRRRC